MWKLRRVLGALDAAAGASSCSSTGSRDPDQHEFLLPGPEDLPELDADD